MKATISIEPHAWTKVEIIRHLSDINGYKKYLEIVTPITGVAYANVDRSKFDTCHRLMYRCPDSFDDGMDIDFRSADLDISECISQINDRRLLYDVILVDPWHEYETSFRDLKEAFDLVRVGGSIVVHDCLPPCEEVAIPHFIPGGWAGVTFRAYVDFVLLRSDLRYLTVDTDWGCGVIRKLQEDSRKRKLHSFLNSIFGRAHLRSQADQQDVLRESWKKIGGDYRSAYGFLLENKRELLKLVTVDEFLGDQGPIKGGA